MFNCTPLEQKVLMSGGSVQNHLNTVISYQREVSK